MRRRIVITALIWFLIGLTFRDSAIRVAELGVSLLQTQLSPWITARSPTGCPPAPTQPPPLTSCLRALESGAIPLDVIRSQIDALTLPEVTDEP